jgi:hypothetical protein
MNDLSQLPEPEFDPVREPVSLGSALDDLFAGWGK